MKSLHRFLLAALALVATPAYAAPVAQTLGSNLTAYNGASGAMTNNTWNSMINARGGADASNAAPKADFGNCNALILRCAQPKCANGGCADLSVAATIVSGCVNSNETCQKHGDDLVQYISAQLVASSTATIQQQQLAAQQAASAAAAQQNAAQMQQMQAQMQQMQADMAAQNAATVAQMQAALDEQKQIAADAIAAATTQQNVSPVAESAPVSGNLTAAQQNAAAAGVSADILAREQISGQIMSAIENAETSLKTLKATMDDAFTYAGCDKNGSNCTGPTRVKAFKQRAMNFFEPYNNVLDELYDALIMAQSLGVDITDIYMMLNGTCNAWALYLCTNGQTMHYTLDTCPDGTSVPEKTLSWNADKSRYVTEQSVLGGHKCKVGQVIPMSDGGCQLVQMLSNQDDILYNWLNPQSGDDSMIRVGCASEALDNSMLFRNRKKQATIDIETLERIIEQDAPAAFGSGLFGGTSTPADGAKFCAVTDKTYQDLQKAVAMKSLPKTVCVGENKVKETPVNTTIIQTVPMVDYAAEIAKNTAPAVQQAENDMCRMYGGTPVFENGAWRCNCTGAQSFGECLKRFYGLDQTIEVSSNQSSYLLKSAAQLSCESAGADWVNGRCMCNNMPFNVIGVGAKCIKMSTGFLTK